MDINTQLAQLLYDYSKRKKIADEIFCKEAVKILVKGWNLEDYVKSYFIMDWMSSITNNPFYNSKLRIIVIPLENMLTIFKNKDYIFTRIFKNRNLLRLKKEVINLIIIENIMQELEHAKQEKICNSDNVYSIHDKLVKLSDIRRLSIGYNIDDYKLKRIFNSLKDEYDKFDTFYICNQNERFADIKSFSRLLNVNSKVENNYFLNEFLDYMKLITIGNSYKASDICPLQTYVDIKEKIVRNYIPNYTETEIRDIILNTTDISQDEACLYGLPLSSEDKKILKLNIKNNLISKIRNQKFVRYLK